MKNLLAILLVSVMSFSCTKAHDIIKKKDTPPTLVADLEFTMNATAIARTIILDGEGATVTGTVDFGDGTPVVPFSSASAYISHVYSVAGTYVAKVYFTSPMSSLKKIQSNNAEIVTVTGLANATALKTLNLSNNKITSLDVSQTPSLKDIMLYRNNLTSINVSQNVNLTGLVIESNQLTTLDVTSNTLLGALNAKGNNLTTTAVNNLLVQIAAHSVNNGLLVLEGQSPAALPSGAGLTAQAALTGRGWLVMASF